MSKKRTPRIITAVILLFGFAVLVGPAARAGEIKAEDTSDTADKYAAVELLNGVRSQMGLPALTQSAALHNMARNHSRYMRSARLITFEELTEDSYYTGAYPMDRARYCGYTGDYVTEYENRRMSTYSQYVSWCLRDPYERQALLSPGYVQIGFGYEENYYCMALGGQSSPSMDGKILTYPYAGAQNVGMVTAAELSRIPADLSAVMPESIGLPVSVRYYRAAPSSLHFENVNVRMMNTRTQQPVEIFIAAPQDAEGEPGTLILFPAGPYQANTRYDVEASFEVWDGENQVDAVSEQWSFTSAGPEYVGEVHRWEAILGLANAVKLPLAEPDELDESLIFEDMPLTDEWKDAFYAVYRLRADGVLEEEGTAFDPEGYTTREQAAVWLMQILAAYVPQLLEKTELNYQDTFEDINRCGDEARDRVQLAYQLGFIKDQGGGIFNPQVQITRAEMDEITEKVRRTVHIVWADEEESEEPGEGGNGESGESESGEPDESGSGDPNEGDSGDGDRPQAGIRPKERTKT